MDKDLVKRIYGGVRAQSLDIDDVSNLFDKLLHENDLNRPFWHPLGFIHCKIGEVLGGVLRLHIWPINKRGCSEQKYKIHDHIFSLDSYVLTGALLNKEYTLKRIRKKGEGAYFQKYQVKYTPTGSCLEPQNSYYSASLNIAETIRAGTYYSISKGVFHEVEASPSELSVTLVATHNISKEDPCLMGCPNTNAPITRSQDYLNTNDWKNEIKGIADLIKNKLILI